MIEFGRICLQQISNLCIMALILWSAYMTSAKFAQCKQSKTSEQLPIHHHHHFQQVPLRVRSAERRHQSPEWTVLRQVNCVIHIEVAGFQILLNGNTRTSQWSPPVSCGGSC